VEAAIKNLNIIYTIAMVKKMAVSGSGLIVSQFFWRVKINFIRKDPPKKYCDTVRPDPETALARELNDESDKA
jgi:hypothetical protein